MKQVEPIIKEIFGDSPTKYLIQEEFDEICAIIDFINKPKIIYLPQDELESLDDTYDNKFQEDFYYDTI